MAASNRQPRLWRPALSETLREAIRNSSMSIYRLAKEAGVSPAVITRFLKGQRDLRLSTVERIAEVLGLEFVQTQPVFRRDGNVDRDEEVGGELRRQPELHGEPVPIRPPDNSEEARRREA